MGKLEDIAIFIDWLAIVPSLGEGSLLSKVLIFSVVDGTEERRAAVLGTGNKVDGHDALNPLTAGELKHVVAASVAA